MLRADLQAIIAAAGGVGPIRNVAKALHTSGTDLVAAGRGGLLTPDQESEFLTTVFDLSVETLRSVRNVRFTSTKYKVPHLDFDRRSTRKHVETVADDTTKGTTSEREIEPEFVVLAYGLSDEFMKNNVEGSGIVTTLTEIIGLLFGNDQAELAWLGDPSTDGGVEDAAFKQITKGWRAHMAESSDVNVLDIGGVDVRDVKQIIQDMIAKMPKKYKRVNATPPTIMLPVDFAEAYANQLSDRLTTLGDSVYTSGSLPPYAGYPVVRDINLPAGEAVFTSPANLVVGTRTGDMTLEPDREADRAVTSYYLRTWYGFQLSVSEAIVWARPSAYVPGVE